MRTFCPVIGSLMFGKRDAIYYKMHNYLRFYCQ